MKYSEDSTPHDLSLVLQLASEVAPSTDKRDLESLAFRVMTDRIDS